MGLGLKIFTTLLEQGQIEVDSTRCLHSRYKNSSCTKCVDVCPEDAISLKKEFAFSISHCQECMNCISVCPTGVFWDRKTVQRYESITKRPTVMFSCNKQGNSREHVLFSCLKHLKPTHLLYGLVHSEEVNILLDEAECRSCSSYQTGVVEYVKELIEEVNRISIIENRDVILQGKENLDRSSGSMEVMTRKQLFEMLKNRTVSSTIEPLIPNVVRKDGKGKLTLHHEERLLNSLLDKYGCADLDISGELFNKAKVKVKDNCDGCGKCSLFCPTGSLSAETKNGIFYLSQKVETCLNCGLCKESCSYKAIELEYRFSLGEIRNKYIRKEIKMTKCSECGKSVPKGGKCAECAKKNRLEKDIVSFFS